MPGTLKSPPWRKRSGRRPGVDRVCHQRPTLPKSTTKMLQGVQAPPLACCACRPPNTPAPSPNPDTPPGQTRLQWRQDHSVHDLLRWTTRLPLALGWRSESRWCCTCLSCATSGTSSLSSPACLLRDDVLLQNSRHYPRIASYQLLSWSARDLGSNDSLNKLVEESAVMGGLTPTLTLILTLIEGECCDGRSDRCHR